MEIVLKYSVQILEQPVLRRVISTITEIDASNKCGNLPVITLCLRIHNNTFLVVCKHCSNDLNKKVTILDLINHLFSLSIS